MNIDIKKFYWNNLTIMKKVLSLYEYRVGKNSDEYRYFKQETMSYFYEEIDKFYKDLVKTGIAEKCLCGAKIRQGYTSCKDCGGSSYKNKKIE